MVVGYPAAFRLDLVWTCDASRTVATLQVIDPVEDYLKLLRTIFDFDALKALLGKPDFSFTFDAMHGVSGPYARRIFVQVAHWSLFR